MAEASVVIRRPTAEVFRFYRDLAHLPAFAGDVMSVEPRGARTYRWTVQGPWGLRLRWVVRITDERENRLIRYQTVASVGLVTRWEVHFTELSPGETEVHEVMTVPLAPVTSVALAVVRKNPAQEVASNLRRLKELLEDGTVVTTDHSVRGKFG
jgi:uncharacterized membrane protein